MTTFYLCTGISKRNTTHHVHIHLTSKRSCCCFCFSTSSVFTSKDFVRNIIKSTFL